jgi:hypothetical protein
MGDDYAQRDRGERQQQRLTKTHMALVAMCAEILRESERQALLNDRLGLKTNRDRAMQMIEICQNNEHLVSAVIRVTPSLTNSGIEKV